MKNNVLTEDPGSISGAIITGHAHIINEKNKELLNNIRVEIYTLLDYALNTLDMGNLGIISRQHEKYKEYKIN